MRALLRAYLARSVKTKGLQGGSTLWLLIGAAGVLRRGYDRMGRKTETINLGEQLRPGDELILRYPGKPHRRTRKELKVIAKRDAKALAAHQAAVSKLEAKIDKGGFGARKARKALASLTPPTTR